MNTSTIAVLSMETTPESVVETTRVLIGPHPPEKEDVLDTDADKWFENVSKLILNWFSLGQMDCLNKVRLGFRKLIGESDKHMEFLERFAPKERVLLRVASVEELLSHCEFTANRVRFTADVAGSRNKSRRDALVLLLEKNRPMRVSEFLEKVFETRTNADSILERLTEIGFLHCDIPETGKGKTYALTLEGRAAGTLAEEIRDEEQSEKTVASRFSSMEGKTRFAGRVETRRAPRYVPSPCVIAAQSEEQIDEGKVRSSFDWLENEPPLGSNPRSAVPSRRESLVPA